MVTGKGNLRHRFVKGFVVPECTNTVDRYTIVEMLMTLMMKNTYIICMDA